MIVDGEEFRVAAENPIRSVTARSSGRNGRDSKQLRREARTEESLLIRIQNNIRKSVVVRGRRWMN